MDAASENAAVLVSLTAAGHVQVWDAQTETCMASFDADAISLVRPHCCRTWIAVPCSSAPDGRRLKWA